MDLGRVAWQRWGGRALLEISYWTRLKETVGETAAAMGILGAAVLFQTWFAVVIKSCIKTLFLSMSVDFMGFCCCFYLQYQCLKGIIYDIFFCNTEINTVLAHSSNSELGSILQGVESCWIRVFLFVFKVVYLAAFCFRDWNRNMHLLKAVKAMIICCLSASIFH